MKELTQDDVEQYVRKPSYCPYCGGDAIGDSFNTDEGQVCQEMSCEVCESTWQDYYLLAGIYDETRNETIIAQDYRAAMFPKEEEKIMETSQKKFNRMVERIERIVNPSGRADGDDEVIKIVNIIKQYTKIVETK